MESKTWKDRLKDEVWDLDTKMLKLEKYLVNKDTSDPDYGIMRAQLVHMNDYMNDLLARCKCYEIEVKRPRFEKSNTIKSETKTESNPSDQQVCFDMFV